MFVDVYRMECKLGEGIYGNVRINPCDDFSNRRPMPQSDGIPYVDSSEYFGFESIDALEHWFGNTFDRFREEDAKLCRYRIHVQHVRRGRRQLVFKMEFAVKLEAVNVF